MQHTCTQRMACLPVLERRPPPKLRPGARPRKAEVARDAASAAACIGSSGGSGSPVPGKAPGGIGAQLATEDAGAFSGCRGCGAWVCMLAGWPLYTKPPLCWENCGG